MATPDVDAGVERTDGFSLANWFVTDISTDTLRLNHGPQLQRYGARVLAVDLFEMFKLQELQGPSLIIVSCLCPTTEMVPRLCDLIRKYGHFNPDAAQRRSMFDSWAFEAIVGQMPSATVVSLCRTSDMLKPGSTPCISAPMDTVPGYVPKACNHPPGDNLHELSGGSAINARVSLNGPLHPSEYIGPTGKFNLVEACCTATALGIKVVFLAEWDGSLSLGCAHGVMHYEITHNIPSLIYKAPSRVPEVRTMNGYTLTYRDFFDYAEEREAFAVFCRLAGQAAERDEFEMPADWPPHGILQPFTSLNAGCMWFYSKVSENISPHTAGALGSTHVAPAQM